MTALLLIAAAFCAAAISGAVGFGGALLMLPILQQTVGIAQAIPLLAITQAVGNAARVALNWRCIAWRPVLTFSVTAIPGAVVGALFFAAIPTAWLTRLAGGAILLFVALDLAGKIRLRPSLPVMLFGGAVTGLVSGLVGSAGPIGAAVFYGLGLPPLAYIASDATASLLIHGAKAITYGMAVDTRDISASLTVMMSVAMVAGTWAGKVFAARVSHRVFRWGVAAVMLASGISMVLLDG